MQDLWLKNIFWLKGEMTEYYLHSSDKKCTLKCSKCAVERANIIETIKAPKQNLAAH